VDWDDTLMASSWLLSNDLRLDSTEAVPEPHASQLKRLEASVVALLERSLELADVYVITNAEAGWVELSARKWMPAVSALLSRVVVCSARSTYERMYPERPSSWKQQAFVDHIRAHFAGCPAGTLKNVISLGDSVHERTALHTATKALATVQAKSVKFVERPSVEALTRQIDLMLNILPSVVSHQGGLDLMLSMHLLT
jgi:hypothetical protein